MDSPTFDCPARNSSLSLERREKERRRRRRRWKGERAYGIVYLYACVSVYRNARVKGKRRDRGERTRVCKGKSYGGFLPVPNPFSFISGRQKKRSSDARDSEVVLDLERSRTTDGERESEREREKGRMKVREKERMRVIEKEREREKRKPEKKQWEEHSKVALFGVSLRKNNTKEPRVSIKNVAFKGWNTRESSRSIRPCIRMQKKKKKKKKGEKRRKRAKGKGLNVARRKYIWKQRNLETRLNISYDLRVPPSVDTWRAKSVEFFFPRIRWTRFEISWSIDRSIDRIRWIARLTPEHRYPSSPTFLSFFRRRWKGKHPSPSSSSSLLLLLLLFGWRAGIFCQTLLENNGVPRHRWNAKLRAKTGLTNAKKREATYIYIYIYVLTTNVSVENFLVFLRVHRDNSRTIDRVARPE